MHQIITKNYKVKIFSLVLASVLWFYVAASQNTVAKLPGTVNIKAINVPTGLTAIYDTKTVDLKIMADPATWKKISADSFSAYVDLSALTEGTYELNVNVTSSVAGVQIVERNPDKILVSLEQVITKEVPISKKVEGSAGEGLIAGNIDLETEKATVKGPKSLINNITDAVATIKLNGESEDFSKVVALSAYSDNGDLLNNIEFNPTQVMAKVSLIKGSNSKTVGIKVKTIGSTAPGFYVSEINVLPETLDVVGSKDVLSSVTYIETENIDITGLSKAFERDVSLSLQNGLALQASSPTKVKVSIKILDNDLTKQVYPQITAKNLPSGYTITSYVPTSISAFVSGPKSILDATKTSDLQLEIDYGSRRLTQSKETLVVDIAANNFRLPSGVSLASFTPSSITVVLEKK